MLDTTPENQREAAKVAKDLAEGISAQSRHSNRVWLALIAASVLAVYPDVEHGLVKLPFSLGSVDVSTYSIVSYLILAALMISYCHTFATAHVAARIVRETIESFKLEAAKQKAWDAINLHQISPLSRVAPLALLLNRPKIAAIYYCMLKFAAIAVLFGIPFSAVVVAFLRISKGAVGPWIYALALVAFCITLVAATQMLVVEFLHTKNVARLFWLGKLANHS